MPFRILSRTGSNVSPGRSWKDRTKFFPKTTLICSIETSGHVGDEFDHLQDEIDGVSQVLELRPLGRVHDVLEDEGMDPEMVAELLDRPTASWMPSMLIQVTVEVSRKRKHSSTVATSFS